MSTNHLSSDGLFNMLEPLVLNGSEEAKVCEQRTVVDLNGWLLYKHEAESVRDWLNEVLS